MRCSDAWPSGPAGQTSSHKGPKVPAG
jgi:hypothetical protein